MNGWLLPRAAVKSPAHGRILACQFSVLAGVPLSLVILKVRLIPHTLNPRP